jgi:predicted ATPase
MTYPGAQIIYFDRPELSSISIEETAHYQITRGMLADPSRYWNYLLGA